MGGASVPHVTTGSGAETRPARARLGAIASALFAAAAAGALLTGESPFGEPLFYVLVPLALAGSLLAARYDGPLLVSAEFGCSMIAVAFLGPSAVFLINVVAEVGTWGVRRYDQGRQPVALHAVLRAMPQSPVECNQPSHRHTAH